MPRALELQCTRLAADEWQIPVVDGEVEIQCFNVLRRDDAPSRWIEVPLPL